MASDPLEVVLTEDIGRWPEKLARQLAADLKPAAVLIPIITRSDRLTVLLTQRSADLKHHAGQISFPGGRMEAHDQDVSATALRETHEEVGIRPEQVAIVGFLPPTPTVTGYAVSPIVGLVDPDIQLLLDPTEVKEAFEVPLGFLLDLSNLRASVREFGGMQVPMVEYNWARRRIWGATASMLATLSQKLLLNA